MTDATGWDNRLDLWDRHEEKYMKRAEGVLERYRDEKNKSKKNAAPKLNILWSNTETMRPAVFSAIPNPVAKRRFLKQDPRAMAGSLILERNLSFSMDNGVDDFESFAEMVANDFLLPGRSVDRAKFFPIDDEDGERLFEEVKYHHVPWKHFAYDPQDRWEDVDWVGYGDNIFTKKALRKEFDLSPAQLAGIPFTDPVIDTEEPTAQVWEFWDKIEKKVVWHVKGANELLREEDPPVDLKGFYDCPEPLYIIKTNDSLIPIPEFTQYQYQADEVNRLTVRIQKIANTIRLNFAYAADKSEDLNNLLTAEDGTGVPVADWAAMLERGGIEGLMAYTPIKESAAALQTLVAQRQTLIQQIFEITGISDIFRGNTDPRETAKAQSLKASFGSNRLIPKQRRIQRYIRNLLRISAEIIAQNFSVETLRAIAGVPDIPPEVMQLLRNDEDRLFSIDIETDSTIAADEQQQKQDVIEFMGALSQLLPVAQQLAAQGGVEVAGQVILWGMRRFRVGGEIEQVIENLMEQIKANPPQQAQQQPDPKLVKVQQDGVRADQKQQFEQNMSTNEFQLQVMQILNEIKNDNAETRATVDKLKAQAAKARQPQAA